AEIFEEKGEAYFREKEALSLRTFEGMHHLILATGGGTPCFHDNIQWMNEHGITIWLNEPTSMLTERLKAEKNHRPLVAALS
ncbi:shikimate kinase, partial [Acinetobacter baumannii]